MVQNQSLIGPSHRLPLVGVEALVGRTENSMMISFRRLLSFADWVPKCEGPREAFFQG
jgi:hypothetical protein